MNVWLQETGSSSIPAARVDAPAVEPSLESLDSSMNQNARASISGLVRRETSAPLIAQRVQRANGSAERSPADFQKIPDFGNERTIILSVCAHHKPCEQLKRAIPHTRKAVEKQRRPATRSAWQK
jgi:hypothetical protein